MNGLKPRAAASSLTVNGGLRWTSFSPVGNTSVADDAAGMASVGTTLAAAAAASDADTASAVAASLTFEMLGSTGFVSDDGLRTRGAGLSAKSISERTSFGFCGTASSPALGPLLETGFSALSPIAFFAVFFSSASAGAATFLPVMGLRSDLTGLSLVVAP